MKPRGQLGGQQQRHQPDALEEVGHHVHDQVLAGDDEERDIENDNDGGPDESERGQGGGLEFEFYERGEHDGADEIALGGQRASFQDDAQGKRTAVWEFGWESVVLGMQ